MTEQNLRVALRTQGEWWVAYLALPDTMISAVEMCRVRSSAVRDSPTVKRAFIDFAQAVAESAFEKNGTKVERWKEPVPAPDQERTQ